MSPSGQNSGEFEKQFNENIMSVMEMMKQPWSDIMIMPYNFFQSLIKWKMDLEDDKRKKLDESRKKTGKTRPKPLRIGEATGKSNRG